MNFLKEFGARQVGLFKGWVQVGTLFFVGFLDLGF